MTTFHYNSIGSPLREVCTTGTNTPYTHSHPSLTLKTPIYLFGHFIRCDFLLTYVIYTIRTDCTTYYHENNKANYKCRRDARISAVDGGVGLFRKR